MYDRQGTPALGNTFYDGDNYGWFQINVAKGNFSTWVKFERSFNVKYGFGWARDDWSLWLNVDDGDNKNRGQIGGKYDNGDYGFKVTARFDLAAEISNIFGFASRAPFAMQEFKDGDNELVGYVNTLGGQLTIDLRQKGNGFAGGRDMSVGGVVTANYYDDDTMNMGLVYRPDMVPGLSLAIVTKYADVGDYENAAGEKLLRWNFDDFRFAAAYKTDLFGLSLGYRNGFTGYWGELRAGEDEGPIIPGFFGGARDYVGTGAGANPKAGLNVAFAMAGLADIVNLNAGFELRGLQDTKAEGWLAAGLEASGNMDDLGFGFKFRLWHSLWDPEYVAYDYRNVEKGTNDASYEGGVGLMAIEPSVSYAVIPGTLTAKLDLGIFIGLASGDYQSAQNTDNSSKTGGDLATWQNTDGGKRNPIYGGFNYGGDRSGAFAQSYLGEGWDQFKRFNISPVINWNINGNDKTSLEFGYKVGLDLASPIDDKDQPSGADAWKKYGWYQHNYLYQHDLWCRVILKF